MNPSEVAQNTAKSYSEILKQWPIERIKALPEMPGLSVNKLSGVLGLTPRTLRLLMDGTYTPSPTLCRRMEMLEEDIKSGVNLHTELLPKKSEMRRRLLLFRSWWLNRDPTKELPEVTVSIRVRWGKGTINVVEIPALLPKLRINSFTGLIQTIQAVTKSMRSVARGYNKLLWTQIEEEWWRRYLQDDFPAIVAKKIGIPRHAGSKRKVRPFKDAAK